MIGSNLIGIVKRHPDGFGFFIPENKDLPDIYIPKTYMQGVMSNDKVEVCVSEERGSERLRGRVTKILQRTTSHITGRAVVLSEKEALILDQGQNWGENLKFSFSQPHIKNSDWVNIEIKTYPGHPKGFTGILATFIGSGKQVNSDNSRVLFENQIPQKFSKDALLLTENMPEDVSKKDFKNRRDLTQMPFITIDGATAQDFDDAIFVQRQKEGFKIFVAIADVSHYVKAGTTLDKEAYDRGTSTYFPNFVNPMLPEKLSNNLCSLRPHQNRLAFVATIDISHRGELLSSEFYEAVIHSHARVTYGQAQEVISGHETKESQKVKDNILAASNAANILMRKRFQEGSLNLDIPETQVSLDEAGCVVDITQATRLFAHKMIEELMLLANVAVAKSFADKSKSYIFRVHESPKPESLKRLQSFMETLGYKKKLHSQALQKRLTQALNAFSDSPKKDILNILVLRTMNPAQYSDERIGHFGLCFPDYTHFTSPIRRYPDLIVHRLLKALLKIKTYEPECPPDIPKACTWLSACEQRSVKAERQLIAIKKARFMKAYVGREFEGRISSVTKFGVFVLLRDYDVDGLVRVADLSSQRLIFDEEHLRLVGKKSGLSYNVGDSIKIQVAAVNEDLGKIDFLPLQKEAWIKRKGTKQRVQHKSKKKQSSKKSRKAQKNSRGIRKTRV